MPRWVIISLARRRATAATGHGSCEALAEEDGGLSFGQAPPTSRHGHSFSDRFKTKDNS